MSTAVKQADECYFVIETDCEDPKTVAVAAHLPVVVEEGFRIRAVLQKSAFKDYWPLEGLLDK